MIDQCRHVEDAPAWVLGALDQSESLLYAAHIEGCEVCRAEIAELGPAARTLALGVEQVEPPASLRHAIMAEVESQAELLRAAGPEADRPKRSRRWFNGVRPALAGSLAALLVAVGVGAGVLVSNGGDDGGSEIETLTGKAQEGMSAVATVSDDHATLHFKGMDPPPEGRVYQVWLLRDGKVVPSTALFDVPKGGSTTVEVPEALDGASNVMVSDEPAGGSKAPTSEPSVDVELLS